MGELVVDLLETAGLIPEEKRESVREQAKHLPVVQVLINEGLASSEAITRIVAAQHGLPVVELSSVGIDPMAAEIRAAPRSTAGDGRSVRLRR